VRGVTRTPVSALIGSMQDARRVADRRFRADGHRHTVFGRGVGDGSPQSAPPRLVRRSRTIALMSSCCAHERRCRCAAVERVAGSHGDVPAAALVAEDLEPADGAFSEEAPVVQRFFGRRSSSGDRGPLGQELDGLRPTRSARARLQRVCGPRRLHDHLTADVAAGRPQHASRLAATFVAVHARDAAGRCARRVAEPLPVRRVRVTLARNGDRSQCSRGRGLDRAA